MHSTTMIFDFDGTIADTHHFMVDICNQLAPVYGYNPIPSDDIERLRDKSARELIEHLKIPMLKVPAIVTKAKHIFHDGIAGVSLIEGMHDVLHTLHARGVKLGILSSNDRKNIDAFLINHDIHVFDFIHGARTIWGKHHSLKKMLRQQHLEASSVFYVGDETRDVVCARQANVASVAVSWGCNSSKRLSDESPDHLLEKPNELLTLCEA
jgi:phosphoglycolate phosphatase